MNQFAVVLQVILGISMVLAGLAHLSGARPIRDAFTQGRLPTWLRLATGALELVGGGLVLGGLLIAPLTAFGALLLAAVMAGALVAELARIRRQGGWIAPATLLAAALGVVYLRPLGVQLLALPQQAPAIAVPVVAREVAAFPAGAFLESVAQDSAGNLYISKTTGADIAAGDLSAARGELVRLAPDGALTTFATLPPGTLAGVIAIGPDETIYLTVGATSAPQYHGVWSFSPDGAGQIFAALPPVAGPNGITFGPGGELYVADSNQGMIWRIDEAGQVEAWLENPQLGARPWLGLFPGANGVQFWGDSLYVAVSDRGQILRVPIGADGSPGPISVVAEGVPTDDFALDADGNLYVTTHPFNSVVRVRPDGRHELLAGVAEGVVGPTDVVFGTQPADQGALYVVTDGGLFEGRAEQRPALVRLEGIGVAPVAQP
jgi:sugar lactone lactonase YvrE